jgi:hypothetical protein
VNVEKAAAPAPFVTIFTANEVRREHVAASNQQSVKSQNPHPTKTA